MATVVRGSRGLMTSDTTRPHSRRGSSAKDVARLAGVSVTTVSRVFSGQADVIPKETQDRVRATAAKLRYRPNSLAKALRQGKTQTIGLIVPDISDAYFHQIARGVEDVAQASGYTVIFANTDRLAEKEQACVNLLLDKKVDGIIFTGGGVNDDSHLNQYDWDGMRVITIGPHRLPFSAILVDDEAVIATATKHLADIGCRRILCVAGQSNWLITQKRLAGYRRAVAEAGLDDDPALIMFGGFSQEAGERMTRRAIDDGIAFDGIVAFNDYAAVGAIQVLREKGRRIPEEVAVVGCDDTPLAALTYPSLTSIRFPQYELGRVAAELVLGQRENSAEPLMFPHEIIQRESTARLCPLGQSSVKRISKKR